VKKSDQETKILNSDISSTKDIEVDKIKTTNVNILLNRVRLDKKRTLKKRILFSLILATMVSSLAVYFII
jgi:hypothetical protein